MCPAVPRAVPDKGEVSCSIACQPGPDGAKVHSGVARSGPDGAYAPFGDCGAVGEPVTLAVMDARCHVRVAHHVHLKGHCLIFLSAIYQLFIEYFNIK